ncbi:MAG TPA: AMP-binding protein [Pyrinomonadaceae bacterium]|jgi:acetyl-CoA synthetase
MNEQDSTFDQPVAWRPTEDVFERAQLTKFIKQVGARDFDDLYRKSIENVEWFTGEVLKFLDIRFNPPYEKLLDLSDGIQFPHWCVGGGLNITEMCLDRWLTDEMKNQPAIIWEGEEGETRTLTYAELMRDVEFCASGLRMNGLGKGDAVGIHLPMMIETIVALLAINRIGAIAVPVFSGYGANAIETRLNAVKAKALFTCDGFPRRGKIFDAYSVAEQAAENCPTIEKVIFVKRTEDTLNFPFPNNSKLRNSYTYFNLLLFDGEEGVIEGENFSEKEDTVKRVELRVAKEKAKDLRYLEPTNAEDPLIILYTSGTTGKPKGIAHTHCGFPIKAAQDMAFGTDVGRGTRISWVTDIGWMMGPWLIYGALINGATICIYDGAPDYPEADRMWEFCARHKVEILGISPTLVRALANCGDDLPKKHDLSALRAFASTGEPWNPVPWWWLFEKVGDSKLPIINYSGGTEISGGILMGNPLLPIKPCSFPAPCPGIAADVLDENGKSVEAGKVGELAIREPWIGMARSFWQERERYLETYWSRFENIWVHGDFAMKDADGHWFILGRSDDTLKVAGKRVGPAEVESLLVGHPLVAEAAVIGVPDELKGTAMIAFCVLTIDRHADFKSAALEEELKNLVAEAQGKPLKPNCVLFVSALPKTRNAKVMRRVIRAAYLGEDAGDLSALENPQAVEEIRNAAGQ